MSKDRLQRLSDANYLLSQCCLFSTSTTGEAVDRQHALIISCGLDAVDFNWSFPKPEARDRGRVIEEAAAHFAARSLPYHFDVPSERVADWAPAFEAAGFAEHKETPRMVLDGLADRRDELAKFRRAAAGLEIEVVTDLGRLVPYRETAFEGFGIPVAAAKLFLTESLLALPGVVCLLGRIDGAPACTSMLIQTGTVAGIYWVATHERFRGRGLGAAMTAAAGEAGLPYGAELASLQASRMGRPVYQRMGFETVGTYVDFRRAT